jgi:hypothetical protein
MMHRCERRQQLERGRRDILGNLVLFDEDVAAAIGDEDGPTRIHGLQAGRKPARGHRTIEGQHQSADHGRRRQAFPVHCPIRSYAYRPMHFPHVR